MVVAHRIVGHLNPHCAVCGATPMDLQANPARACVPREARDVMPLKTLKLTPAMAFQLGRIAELDAIYPNEDEGYLIVEVEKVALADLVIAAVAAQAERLERLPVKARAVPVVVEVALVPKRGQG